MQGLKGRNVIGADIVCIIPTKDSPNNITSLTAMVVMFEQMCLIAEYLRSKK
jgi:guanidinopropionase